MELKDNSSRMPWADNLRAIATVAVVLLHVAAKVQAADKNIAGWQWMTGNFFESMVRFSVPVFLMLTGALILPREYTLKDFLVKRTVRLLFPFLFWSIIYIIFNYCIYDWAPQLNTGYKSWLSVLKWATMQLLRGASFHLWYVYTLIGIYMFIPIIGKWLRSCSNREIGYFLLVWLATLFFNLPHVSKFMPAIELRYFSGFVGYVVLGYYLTRLAGDESKKSPGLWLVMILAGIAITFTGTYIYSAGSGVYNDTFYRYLMPNVLLVAVGMFMLFKRTKDINNYGVKFVRNAICKYSYGIYLAHPLVLYFLDKGRVNWELLNPFVGIVITTATGVLLSSLLVYAVSKLPYGKYISG